MSGDFRMRRGWMDNPVLRLPGGPFDRRSAWAYLIEHARYGSDGVVETEFGTAKIARGQLSASNRYLAKAWKWDEKKVRRFLGACAAANMIECGSAAGQNLITIVNYEQLQNPYCGGASHPASPTPQPRRTTASKKKEGCKEGCKAGEKESSLFDAQLSPSGPLRGAADPSPVDPSAAQDTPQRSERFDPIVAELRQGVETAARNAVAGDKPPEILPDPSCLGPYAIRKDFADFWEAYPRKVGKQAAMNAFIQACRKTSVAAIANGLNRQIWPENKQYIPYPATWLNQGRWEDDPTAAAPRAPEKLSPMDQIRRDNDLPDLAWANPPIDDDQEFLERFK